MIITQTTDLARGHTELTVLMPRSVQCPLPPAGLLVGIMRTGPSRSTFTRTYQILCRSGQSSMFSNKESYLIYDLSKASGLLGMDKLAKGNGAAELICESDSSASRYSPSFSITHVWYNSHGPDNNRFWKDRPDLTSSHLPSPIDLTSVFPDAPTVGL